MSGIYSIPFAYTGAANVDLCEIVAATGKPLIIVAILGGQTSDVGDAQEEILRLSFKSGQTTTGSGGTTATAVNNESGGAAASLTAKQANTTKATGGTIIEHFPIHWNVRTEFDKILPEIQQVTIPAGVRCTLEIPAAADSLTVSGVIIVQEIG